MVAPLIAPFVITAAAAATAGWFGARWLGRRRSDDARLHGRSEDASGIRPARGTAQTMMWCGGCGTYVLPSRGVECTRPDCRYRP
jgi:hypothetical protein